MKITVPLKIFNDSEKLNIYLKGVAQGFGKRGTVKDLDHAEATTRLLNATLVKPGGAKHGFNFDELYKKD